MNKTDPEKKTGKKQTILIVEDSATQAQKLHYILEEENFNVFWAENGKKAFEFLETQIPIIIISDVLMPEMNGFEFCSTVKKDDRYKNNGTDEI